MMQDEKVFYCPVNGWDCEHWREGGACAMIEKNMNPLEECDDAAFFWKECFGETEIKELLVDAKK